MALFQDISIHGVPQIFDNNTSLLKRFSFFLIILISFAGSAFFIHETISHYRSNPVYSSSVVVIDSEKTPLEWPDLVLRFDILPYNLVLTSTVPHENSSVVQPLFNEMFPYFINESSVAVRKENQFSTSTANDPDPVIWSVGETR